MSEVADTATVIPIRRKSVLLRGVAGVHVSVTGEEEANNVLG
jgi:hypothetical protein